MALIMKKNCLNLSKNFLKLLAILLTILLIKNGFNFSFLADFKLFKTIDIDIEVDFGKTQKSDFQKIVLDFKDFVNTNKKAKTCAFIPPGLVGKVEIEHTVLSEKQIETNTSILSLNAGGHWRPKDCQARHKVALIIPYRDRYQHLLLFLNHMHKFLQKQNIEYAIYIIEEVPNKQFNRAMLMNIGSREALKDVNWDCFVFHDVDLVPEDDRNFYHCPMWPRHMSVAVNTLQYKLPYKEIFGGVSAIQRKHFELINGYSNLYFGWGGEDDDFAERILSHGLKIIRYPDTIGRYYMLLHSKDIPSKQRYKLLGNAKERFKTDGLNSLEYTVIKKEYRRLYTWVLVSFKENSSR